MLLTGCSSRGGVPDPASTQGEEVLDLWRILLGAGIAVGALVAGLVLWSVVRYRRPRGAGPDDLPKQTDANIPIEVFYTVVPLVIVALLFGLTMRTQNRVTKESESPDLAVEVTGFQWGWRFRYPAQGVTITGDANTPPTLVLPVGANVRLRLVAADVVHSFFVPAFLVKKDLIPGVDNSLEIRPSSSRALPGGLRRVLRPRPLAHDLRRRGGQPGGVPGLRRRAAAGAGRSGQRGHRPRRHRPAGTAVAQ